ncbi:MAG: hypothetical protein ACFCVB_12160 [Nodosilinea sp.]
MASQIIVGSAVMAVAGTILHILEFAMAEAILSAIGIAFARVGVIVLAIGRVEQAEFDTEKRLVNGDDYFRQNCGGKTPMRKNGMKLKVGWSSEGS